MNFSMRLPLAALVMLIFLAGVSTPAVYAQAATTDSIIPAPEARQSPVAIAAARLNGDGYVKVVYGSPRMRGREIFGGLVPFEEVWRTGANEATEVTITVPTTIAGERLDAGTYALFTIPREESWTIILNRGLGQWGAYEYNEDLDYLRVDVPVEAAAARHEAFTIRFDEADNGTDMVLLWEDTRVRVPIRTS